MIVKIIETGELKEYEDGYAARLIEQGIATTDLGPGPVPPIPPPDAYNPSQLSSMIEAGSYVHLQGHTLVYANPRPEPDPESDTEPED